MREKTYIRSPREHTGIRYVELRKEEDPQPCEKCGELTYRVVNYLGRDGYDCGCSSRRYDTYRG